jgi:hypothetical protein
VPKFIPEHADKRYFLSAPAGDLGPPTLFISGCIFSEVAGAWPVVAGSGALASGMVAAAGRSGVPVLGLFAAGGAALGLAAAGKSRVGAWADTMPPLMINSAAMANTADCFIMAGPPVDLKENAFCARRVPLDAREHRDKRRMFGYIPSAFEARLRRHSHGPQPPR